MNRSREKILLRIIGLYLLIYFGLLFIYNGFLRQQTPDFFTTLTAKQVNALYRFSGYDTTYSPLENPAEIGIFSSDKWMVKIIEGCNGISIIIVFLAFIWAFPAPVKRKLLFSAAGIIVIWLMNIWRIYALGLIYYHHPRLFDIAHRILFPAVMYAVIVVLWVIWIRRIKTTKTTPIAE